MGAATATATRQWRSWYPPVPWARRRISRSRAFPFPRALPGELNETANLEYPISFLFCADLQPNGTTFSQPVKLRVKNTWGFAAGTGIPFAFWDKENQTWVPEGMARVNADKSWLEAEISHFSYLDINMPSMARTAGHPNVDVGPPPDSRECMASSVDVHGGSLHTDLVIPGVKVRGGDTGISLAYNSSTAFPTSVLRVLDLHEEIIVVRPERTELKVFSTLLAGDGGSGGFAALGNFHFNAPNGYGAGALIFNGVYPSGTRGEDRLPERQPGLYQLLSRRVRPGGQLGRHPDRIDRRAGPRAGLPGAQGREENIHGLPCQFPLRSRLGAGQPEKAPFRGQPRRRRVRRRQLPRVRTWRQLRRKDARRRAALFQPYHAQSR